MFRDGKEVERESIQDKTEHTLKLLYYSLLRKLSFCTVPLTIIYYFEKKKKKLLTIARNYTFDSCTQNILFIFFVIKRSKLP